LPYWRTIPAAGDEINQTIYALQIAQGQRLPLVGNDAYAGPFFFYLLAGLFRLGLQDPLLGGTIVLIAGTATVPVTYAWMRELGNGYGASLLAGLLVAFNPHLILLNSHVGGTTFLLPFLLMVGLWLLCAAVNRDRPGLLMAGALVCGLALQSNPLAALAVAGSWVWLSVQSRRMPRLGRRWPLWPVLAGLCVGLVYAPVIIYNLQSGLGSLTTLNERSYLWQAQPSLATFFPNLGRLSLQLVRQLAGVLRGDETLRTIWGLPLLYGIWACVGLAFTAWQGHWLPLAVLLPYVLLMPYFSGHYGMVNPVRFTSLLTPPLAGAMAVAGVALWKRVSALRWPREGLRDALGSGLALLLAAYPLLSLFEYYAEINARHRNGRPLLELSQQVVAHNDGQAVYISETPEMLNIPGIPYVPRAYPLFANIYQEFIPPIQIVGRLFETRGPAFIFMTEQDAAFVGQYVELTAWPGPANEEALLSGYGLYEVRPTAVMTTPSFVLRDGNLPASGLDAVLGEGIALIGHETPAHIKAGERLAVDLYWQSVGPVEPGTYVGFVHLYDPATAALIAQDDHVLGRDLYPVTAWRPDEVVVDRYTLPVPADASAGTYALRTGVYTWPDLTRLNVSGSTDDVVEFAALDITP
jgi:hypothetical protein